MARRRRNQQAKDARQLVAFALDLLGHVATGTAPSVKGTASTAFESIWRAALIDNNLHQHLERPAADVEALILQCAEPIIEATNGKLEEHLIHLCLGAASSLLSCAPDELFDDRLSYAALLSAELAVLHHREAVARRGDPLQTALLAAGRSLIDPSHRQLH